MRRGNRAPTLCIFHFPLGTHPALSGNLPLPSHRDRPSLGDRNLLPDFPEGSSIEDMIVMNNLLINSGACIKEINAVRKHLSVIKGGQIAGAVYPATLINLVLSDVNIGRDIFLFPSTRAFLSLTRSSVPSSIIVRSALKSVSRTELKPSCLTCLLKGWIEYYEKMAYRCCIIARAIGSDNFNGHVER